MNGVHPVSCLVGNKGSFLVVKVVKLIRGLGSLPACGLIYTCLEILTSVVFYVYIYFTESRKFAMLQLVMSSCFVSCGD
jgi:hypothetical protein